jgi:hypothetical protein
MMHQLLLFIIYPIWFPFCSSLFIEKLKILQVHIVQRGAVRPLIEMLQSSDVQLREMSAFALGRLAQVIIYLCMFFTFFKSQFMDTI